MVEGSFLQRFGCLLDSLFHKFRDSVQKLFDSLKPPTEPDNVDKLSFWSELFADYFCLFSEFFGFFNDYGHFALSCSPRCRHLLRHWRSWSFSFKFGIFMIFVDLVNKRDKNEALTRLSLGHLTTVTTIFRHIFISLVSSWPLAQGWLVPMCVCRCALKRGTKWKYMNTSDIDTDTSLSPPAWGHTFTPFLCAKRQKNHTTLFGLNYYLLIICKCLLYLATTSVWINQFSPSS